MRLNGVLFWLIQQKSFSFKKISRKIHHKYNPLVGAHLSSLKPLKAVFLEWLFFPHRHYHCLWSWHLIMKRIIKAGASKKKLHLCLRSTGGSVLIRPLNWQERKLHKQLHDSARVCLSPRADCTISRESIMLEMHPSWPWCFTPGQDWAAFQLNNTQQLAGLSVLPLQPPSLCIKSKHQPIYSTDSMCRMAFTCASLSRQISFFFCSSSCSPLATM